MHANVQHVCNVEEIASGGVKVGMEITESHVRERG